MAIVQVHFTHDSVSFMQRLLNMGAIAGAPSSVSVNPKIRLLVDALYEVLAGGHVTGSVLGGLTITPGNAAAVADLKKMETDCNLAINAANAAAGYSYVIEF